MIPCCPPFFADNFDDTTASTFQWTEFLVAASFTEAVQRYTGADGIMYPAQYYPSGGAVNIPIPERQAARARIRFSDSESGSAQAQLWMGYGISGPGIDRLIAEVDSQPTCGTLRIIQRLEGGTSATVASMPIGPVARAAWHTLTACYHHDLYTGEISFAALLKLSDGRLFRVEIDAAALGWSTDPTLNGTGTRQVSSGMEVDFDHFKMLPHKQDAGTCTCGCPDCRGPCSQVLDGFNRAELGCCWTLTPSGTDPAFWSIDGDELVHDSSAAEALVHLCMRAAPSYTYSGRIYLPSYGSTAQLFALLAAPLDTDYAGAQIEAGTTCGKLRMLQDGTVAGEWVAVPDLTPGWHTLSICYSRDNQVLSATVDGAYSHHLKNVPAPEADHYVGLAVGTGTEYRFANLRLGQSRDAGTSVYYECPDLHEIPDRACCAGLELSPSFFAKVFKNGVLLNVEYELDEGFTEPAGYEFRNAANTMQLVCNSEDAPYFLYDAPGLMHQFELAVESCEPFSATGTYTSGSDTYELEVYQ